MGFEPLSKTMILRMAASLLIGLLILAAARQANRTPARVSARAAGMAGRWLVGLSTAWILAWLAIAAVRITYPHELEWVGGAVLDHCRRVAAGLPIYDAPSRDWVPFMYGPLYYWLGAPLVAVFPGHPFLGLRILSILSAVGSAALVFAWVRALSTTQNVLWALAAVGMMFAAYRMTGAWYDIERIDSVFLLCCLGALFLVEQYNTNQARPAYLAGAAALLLAAFLTKQQGLAFGAAAAVGMVLRGHVRAGAGFSGLAALMCAAAAAALTWRTDGWYWEYAVRQPGRLGWETGLAAQFLLDALLLAPSLALLLAARGCSTTTTREPSDCRLLYCGLAAAWIVSFVSRARWGGDQNVLIPCYVLTFACASVAASRISLRGSSHAALASFAMVGQMLVLAYNPLAQVPTETQRKAGTAYREVLRQEEARGRVLSLDHAGLLRQPGTHTLALRDWLAAGNPLPPDFTQALRERYWSAVVLDGLPDPKSPLHGEILRFYAPVSAPGIAQPWTVTGYPTPTPAKPVWILRPRAESPQPAP